MNRINVTIRKRKYVLTSILQNGMVVIVSDGGGGSSIPKDIHINEVIPENIGSQELENFVIDHKLNEGNSYEEAIAYYQGLTGNIDTVKYRYLISRKTPEHTAKIQSMKPGSIPSPVTADPFTAVAAKAPPSPARSAVAAKDPPARSAVAAATPSPARSAIAAATPSPAGAPVQKIMYLVCLHGTNTAAEHTLFPVYSPFNSVVYYPDAYTSLQGEKAIEFMDQSIGNIAISTELQNGTFKAQSKMSSTGRALLNLPPILLGVNQEDLTNQFYQKYQGVWKVVFINNVVNSVTRLQDQREMLRNFFQGDVTLIRTQAFILNDLETIVRQHGDAPEDVSVGMIVCHSQNLYPELANLAHNKSYATATESPLLASPSELLFLSTIQPEFKYALAGCHAPTFNPSQAWSALARQKAVGCGMNVLSYFGVIEQNDARCRVISLPPKGQTIFAIYAILYDKLILIPTKFIVVRISLTLQNDILFDQLNSLPENLATFVKLYNGTVRSDAAASAAASDNHLGHTISFIKHQGVLYLIDPQGSITQPIQTRQELGLHLQRLYADKDFIDIVYVARQTLDATSRRVYTAEEFRSLIVYIRGRVIELNGLNWGGKRKKNKTKRTKQHIRKTKRTKQQIRKTRR